ncbi:ABC transporter permease [Actinophytocola sp.]|uniref:ABC transporter permease n=1 Tax=Actinophytocola sp. TaxID=1872138 RepID=UPI003D6C5529
MTTTTDRPVQVPPERPVRRRRLRIPRPSHALSAAVIIGLTVGVGYPLLQLVFEVSRGLGSGFETLLRVVRRDAFRDVVLNTLQFVVATVTLSVVLGFLLALLIERTDIPVWRGIRRSLPMISLLMPPLVGALGWVYLFSPTAGLMNELFGSVGIPPFSIYSRPGIFLAGAVYLVPYAYSYASAALQNMDGSHEEAARMSGASPLKTLATITIPAIRPALSGAILVTVMMSLAEISIPLILGSGHGFSTLTLEIYRSVVGSYPSDLLTASVIGLCIAVVALVGVSVQRRVISKGSYATITGKPVHTTKVALGPWRYPAVAFVWLYVAFAIVLPLGAVIYVGSTKHWQPSIGAAEWSLEHFDKVFSTAQFRDSLWNSILLGLFSASAAIVFGVIISYAIVILRMRRIGTLGDYVGNLPLGIPHIVFGLGLLLVLVNVHWIYGTLFALGLAYVILFVPHAVRLISASMRQVGNELHDASHMSGASDMTTLGRITMPLVMPGVRAAWVLIAVLAFRELSASTLLSTGANPVVSYVMVGVYQSGSVNNLAAFATCVAAINVGWLVVAGISARGRRPKRYRTGRKSPDLAGRMADPRTVAP